MLSVSQVLTRLNIDASSRLKAVQDVRELIESSENPLGIAKSIITNLADTQFMCDDPIVARMTAQRLVDDAIVLGDKYDPNEALLKAARKIEEQRAENPWSFWKPVHSTVVTTTEQREGVSVEVKTDGSFKKGSKQVLAQALYAKHKALENKAIVEIFMKELDMSLAGARTYVFNCKRAAK